MSDAEYFEWRLLYPLTSNDENLRKEVKNESVVPFTLNAKLNMLFTPEEKRSNQSSYIDIYCILENTDVCLKLHDIDQLNNFKIELEIRNHHKEQPTSLIQHWSKYEIKYPRLELPDKVIGRLDPVTVEKINKYLHIINDKGEMLNYTDLYSVRLEKLITTCYMTDSDRKIEECDVCLIINDNLRSKNKNESYYIPKYWRTISIQTSDHDKLVKTLTTLQLDDDKDLLDYFSFLISQTCFNSFPPNHQQQLFPTISPEKSYLHLLTMSYAAFIELIQRIHQNPIYLTETKN